MRVFPQEISRTLHCSDRLLLAEGGRRDRAGLPVIHVWTCTDRDCNWWLLVIVDGDCNASGAA